MSEFKKKKTIKIQHRKLKTAQKLENTELFDKFYEEYLTLGNQQIYNESIRIISELKKEKNPININFLEIRLTALKKALDSRLYETGGTEIKSDFNFYPSFEDINFNKKIFYKKEFLINRSSKKTKKVDLDELSRKECGNTNFFKLSNSQKFIKSFISPNTPYNSVLLFYGTGVGKTCSSISIVEQYMPELFKSNKKVYILLNPSIKANFMKNIFNIEKLKAGMSENQCTGNKYLDLINYNSKMSNEEVNKKINQIINSRYKFMGYQEFANFIERLESRNLGSLSEEMKIKIINNKIKQLFSNSIMIIDEAHNIKEAGTKEEKILPPILERIVKISQNMKLILLTATPMFDNSREIRFLINLLLMNDKRPTLKNSDLFDTKGNLTEAGTKILLYNTRGYISYLRGENPIKFPLRLYPDVYNHPQLIKSFPEVDVDGNDIPSENQIKFFKILGCPMEGHQLNNYNSMIEKSETKFGSFDQMGLMVSNIVYPSKSDNYKTCFGNSGFSHIFEKVKRGNMNSYRIKKPEYKDFLSEDKIKQYSSKLHTILNNIKTKEGVIFIYSQFIAGGILPLALMLEYNGFTFVYGNKEETLLESDSKKPKIEINGNKMRFIIISGDKSLSKNSYQEYIKVERNNINGEQIKIILGTETAAEGLDFSNIREVHILDPWHHINKTEQIIGRAIRYCSHINLPLEKRNVIINLYASTISSNPKNDIETVDLKTYRNSEIKSKQMAKVEYLLKQNAVDCNINLESNKFVGEVWDQNVRVKLPFLDKDVYKNINISDKDGSKNCNYTDCDYKCNPDISNVDDKMIDDNTFTDEMIESYTYEISIYIRELYKKQFVYDIEEITKNIESITNTPRNLLMESIYNALESIINKETIIYDKFNRKGNLIYQGGYYIFKPLDLKKSSLTYREISTPLTIKTKKLNITNIIDKIKRNTPETQVNLDVSIREFVSKDSEFLSLIKQDKKLSDEKQNMLIQMFKDIKSFSINWINMSEKEGLLKFVISNSESLTPEITRIKDQLDDNILYFNRDIFFDIKEHKDNNEIFGYKVVDNGNIKYMRYNKSDNKFIPANNMQKRNIQLSINKKVKLINNSIIIGYMEQKIPENTIVLKIRDKTGEGKKGTQIKKGSICGNDGMKKGKIIDFIHKVLSKTEYSGDRKTLPGKYTLCKELEIYLRHNEQNKKDGLKWFYNAEEAIEFNISEKK